MTGSAGAIHGGHTAAGHHPPHHRLTQAEAEAAMAKARTVFTVLFGLMIVAQCLLVYWKKKHHRSYQQVTLFGLWLIPFVFSAELHFYKLLSCWFVWTCSSVYIMWLATRRPLPDRTPRTVYSFFFYAHKVCYGVGSIGYFMIMADFFAIPAILGLQDAFAYYGGILLFFSLYFGILSRDCAEMCTDRMATSMGYGKKGRMPHRSYDPTICLLCGDALNFNWALMHSSIQSQNVGGVQTAERTVELSCGHSFHDFCVRGWTIVGKKDTCPYCSEKVSLRSMFANPWETQSLLWTNLLDAIRYLIVWNPVIVGVTHITLYEMGMSS